MFKGIDLDIYIITSIFKASHDNKEISTWDMAKNFAWKDKPNLMTPRQENIFYTRKSLTITVRINLMKRYGYVNINKKENGKKHYELLGEKIIKKYKFKDREGLALQMKRSDGKWIILEI